MGGIFDSYNQSFEIYNKFKNYMMKNTLNTSIYLLFKKLSTQFQLMMIFFSVQNFIIHIQLPSKRECKKERK
jgi:hypothetical protein